MKGVSKFCDLHFGLLKHSLEKWNTNIITQLRLIEKYG